MKKILILFVCLAGLFLSGCTLIKSESDTEFELKSLGFKNPVNMTDSTSPFEVWSVSIPEPGTNNNILIVRSDNGWIYYPNLLKDIATSWEFFDSQNLEMMMVASDVPCIKTRKMKLVPFVTLALGFKSDLAEDLSDLSSMYYKTSADPIRWSSQKNELYKEPGYITNFSVQTVKDGAVKFFADDPHGNKVLTDEIDIEYKEIYSTVWDFDKGGLR